VPTHDVGLPHAIAVGTTAPSDILHVAPPSREVTIPADGEEPTHSVADGQTARDGNADVVTKAPHCDPSDVAKKEVP